MRTSTAPTTDTADPAEPLNGKASTKARAAGASSPSGHGEASPDPGTRRRAKVLTTGIDPLLIGRTELARLLDISEPTLDRLRAAGRIGPGEIRISGVRYSLSEVREWIDSRRADGTLPTAAEWRAMHAGK